MALPSKHSHDVDKGTTNRKSFCGRHLDKDLVAPEGNFEAETTEAVLPIALSTPPSFVLTDIALPFMLPP